MAQLRWPVITTTPTGAPKRRRCAVPNGITKLVRQLH
jgi:hypothetical protein